jgi:hypothetical protein
MDAANCTTITVSTSPEKQQSIRHDMAATAASSLSAFLYAAAAATGGAVPTGYLRSAGRLLQCASASACSATGTKLPAASEHAAAAEHPKFPTKRHTKSILANTDGCAADWTASTANAATDATTDAATAAAAAAANGSSTDWHAPVPAAAAAATTTTAVRTSTTTTIPTQRAPIRQILHPCPIQLPSTRSPATAPISPRRQRSRRAAAANASSPAKRHDASERQHEPFPAAAAATDAAVEHAHQRY